MRWKSSAVSASVLPTRAALAAIASPGGVSSVDSWA